MVIGGTIVVIPLFFGGLVVIGEREVGIVVKKFTMSGKGLSPDRLIALNGEAGLPADTLAPGWHWGYWPWQYGVKKEQVVVPQSEIALIVAADGSSIPSERIGYVGVVISYVGKAQVDVSGASCTHGNLVNPGHKGVWVEPLYPSKHPLNIQIMKVELVPTTNIVLNLFTNH